MLEAVGGEAYTLPRASQVIVQDAKWASGPLFVSGVLIDASGSL